MEERNNFIKILESDIDTLRIKINNYDKNCALLNRKKRIEQLKNLYSYLKPYLCLYSSLYIIFSLLGCNPLIFDNKKKYNNLIESYDSDGSYTCSSSYEYNKNDSKFLTYYGDWYEKDGDYFERNVDVYNLSYFSTEVAMSYLDANYDYIDSNLISYINESSKEYSNEISGDSHSELVITSVNRNDSILERESMKENLIEFLSYMFLCFLGSAVPEFFNHSIEKYNSKNYEIIKKYEPENLNILKKKLKIKEESYSRLMR